MHCKLEFDRSDIQLDPDSFDLGSANWVAAHESEEVIWEAFQIAPLSFFDIRYENNIQFSLVLRKGGEPLIFSVRLEDLLREEMIDSKDEAVKISQMLRNIAAEYELLAKTDDAENSS